MRAVINFRQGPPELGKRAAGQPLGLTLGQPVRFRDLPRDKQERAFSAYAAAKDAATNSRAVAEDAVVAPVRFISCDLVPGYWMDHRDPGPMKAAVPLFERLQVQSMHCAMPELWLGCVTDAEWDETPMGIAKAPGITGHVAIEAGLSDRHATVARGVELRSLKRWSLGFACEYEASHDEMLGWGCDEFWQRLGTEASDGEVFRFIVTGIPDVYEVSLVDIGAIESALTTDAPDNRTRASGLRAPAQATPVNPATFLALPLRTRTESQR